MKEIKRIKCKFVSIHSIDSSTHALTHASMEPGAHTHTHTHTFRQKQTDLFAMRECVWDRDRKERDRERERERETRMAKLSSSVSNDLLGSIDREDSDKINEKEKWEKEIEVQQ